jgi:hypothetical protein
LAFTAMAYPTAMSLLRPEHSEGGLTMMLSIYVTLGVFLLLAARNPAVNRSLIAFTAWSSLAHAGTTVVQSFQMANERGQLLGGVALFRAIGGVLIVLLACAKPSVAGAYAVDA